MVDDTGTVGSNTDVAMGLGSSLLVFLIGFDSMLGGFCALV